MAEVDRCLCRRTYGGPTCWAFRTSSRIRARRPRRTRCTACSESFRPSTKSMPRRLTLRASACSKIRPGKVRAWAGGSSIWPRSSTACSDPDRLGVCIDTCHTFAAGYPLGTKKEYQATMAALDKTVGVKLVKAFHLNDSKTRAGLARRSARTDRRRAPGARAISFSAERQPLPRSADVPGNAEGLERRRRTRCDQPRTAAVTHRRVTRQGGPPRARNSKAFCAKAAHPPCEFVSRGTCTAPRGGLNRFLPAFRPPAKTLCCDASPGAMGFTPGGTGPIIGPDRRAQHLSIEGDFAACTCRAAPSERPVIARPIASPQGPTIGSRRTRTERMMA